MRLPSTMRNTQFFSGALVLVFGLLAVFPSQALPDDPAGKFFREKSYAQAAALWEKQFETEKPAAESARGRELAFRIADAQWRALASTDQQDRTVYEPWVKKLRGLTERDPADQWSAEAWESLGDQLLAGQRWWGMDQERIRQDYSSALKYWADADASDEARARYLRIVFEYLDGLDNNQLYYQYGSLWPLEIAENAVKLSKTQGELARANFLLAGALQRSGQPPAPALWKRIQTAFASAATVGKKTEWHDDALYLAAQWAERQGRLVEVAPGQYQQRPDFQEALKLYQQLLGEYGKGESRWWDDAKSRVEEISKPVVQVHAGNAFLPESRLEFGLNARNVDKVEISIAKLDLVKALTVQNERRFNAYELRNNITEGIGGVVRKWTVETPVEGAHEMFGKTEKTDPLPAGAYWIQAKAGSVQGGAILLVTRATVSMQGFKNKALIFSCDAMTGAPLAKARIQVLRYLSRNPGNENRYDTQLIPAESGEDGVAQIIFPPTPPKSYDQGVAVVAMVDGQPALLAQGGFRGGDDGRTLDRTYVFTDRPAYRPQDKVQFKFICRAMVDGVYETRPGREVLVRINDPRGEKLLEKTYQLNEFGSAAGNLDIPKEAVLGVYQIELRDKGSNRNMGGQELFRLEEYKLPEFKVEVKMPEKDGVAETFRLGDRVRAVVQADYYSGGPVANAEVEYDLYQEPFYGDNPWPVPYPWLYRGIRSSAPWMSFWRESRGGNLIRRDKAKTDAAGKAVIEFDTPPGMQSWEYRVEARVTDASRRQINGTGSVKVTAFPFNFYLRPEAQVIQPGDTGRIEVKALDANSKGQAVKATAAITREVWVEKSTVSKKTGKKIVTFRGYESREVQRQEVETDKEGKLKLAFKPEETGYYKVRVVSPPVAKGDLDRKSGQAVDRVMGETSLFVADAGTKDLGYRYGALQLFPDKQSYKAGETARIIVVAPQEKSTALLTFQGDGLLGYQVLRMDGAARLAEFKITEGGQPNMFINGFMVREGRALVATEEVVVPPEQHFLKVEVKADADRKKPGEKGVQTIRVTDSADKPVRAELSLGVVDASIYYIQKDLAGDIREFFFGEKRYQQDQVRSMLNELPVRNIGDEEEEREEREGPSEMPWQASGRMLEKAELAARGDAIVSSGAMMTDGVYGGSARKMPMAMAGQTAAAPGAAPMAKDIALSVDEPGPQVTVRSDFRATAFWKPDVVTDAKGEAKIDLQYPDSLTEWKTTARAVTAGAQFGSGEIEVKTSKPVMCRLQVPRFVVERDQVTLSAVVSNQSDREISVKVALEAKNLEPVGSWESSGKIPARGQKRFDRVFAVKAASGIAEVTASATSSGGSDAMKLSLPIVEHGIEKFIARSVVLEAGRDTGKIEWNLDLPEERNPGSARLDFVLAPSLASTCLDALPYLADYPYGCVEQTMSRFMPAAIAAEVLKEMKLEPEAVSGRLFGGMEAGSAAALKMKKGKLEDLDKMVRQGTDRLRDMQHDDGGWGWWKSDETNDFMTAYVVQGLALGRKAGVRFNDGMIERGAAWLRPRLVEYEEDPSMQAWLLYAVAVSGSDWDKFCLKAADRAWEQREKLNAYTRSLLALAFQARVKEKPDYAERARVLVRNLENGVREVKAESALIGAAGSATMPVTCHWGEDGVTYRWSDGGVEATAFALRAMLAVDPQNKRVDQAARWLINNRRGAQWKNTRDTAIVVMSLLDYMKQTRETSPKLKADLKVNGKVVKTVEFTAENALGTLRVRLPDEALKGGANKIELQIQGEGRLYASAFLKYFTKEDPILAAGSEIYVKREYYRETPVKKLLGGVRLEKTLLKDGDTVKSGDRIEVRLLLEAKNNYEFLLFEDKKPAGCEAVQVQSGEDIYARALQANGKYEGESTFVYQELRDVQVAFFITKLPSGQHEIRYMLRAETPGKFHALPTLGHAMYVPEIRANSDEMRVEIGEAESFP